MLQPANRLTLIDAMRPPAGYVLDEAMAVTFTLDLRALLAAPAAFALARAVEVEGGDGRTEPIELLHAVRANAARITIFSQAGEIALPPSRRVFAFLEGSVVAVTAPRGGVVHSKVWVLRYVDPDGDASPQLRVLCASRNLTFDTSWDTVVRLDTLDAGHDDGVVLDAIADLFDVLAGRSVGPLADVHAQRVVSLGADLRARRFALHDGVDDLVVHVLGVAPGPGPLPANADRSLVISPFVSDDVFTRGHLGSIDELVTRAEQADALAPGVVERIGAIYDFDDGSGVDDSVDEDGVALSDPARPLRGLHAKVFAFERGDRAQLFVGSANATGAAFDHNLEVLLELGGHRDAIGIDALCDGAPDEVGLRALFVPHRPAPEVAAETDDPLAAVRRTIGRLDVRGRAEATAGGWTVTYTSSAPLPDAPGLAIECWPLPTPGNRRPVAPGAALSVRFDTSLEALSAFVVFEITDADGVRTSCVVPARLDGVPEERDRVLLRALIGSADRFLRYLLALLADDGHDLGLLDLVDQVTVDGHTADGHGGTGLPVLEHLLRTLRRDPARLAAIDPLVSDLAADDALPSGFVDVWQALRAVSGDRSER